jgi:PKD repeat protein
VVEISVEPRSPKVNETVTISPTLENTGNARGTDLINLYIDGAFKGSRTLTLEPGRRGSVSFNYTFTAAGDHRVEIKTSDDSRSITITVTQPPRPIARFRAEPTSGPPPLTVRFTNLSQNFTTSYWSFGDGNTSTETNPVHTYWAMGSYTVRLTVRGPGGEDTASQTITVLPAPSGLLFQDDFRNPSSGWCIGRSALADYAYENGEYSITVKRPYWLYWCWAPQEHRFPEDFIVEVEARQVSGPNGEYGIVWGKDSDNFYMFAVSTDGRYGMWKQVRDAWQPNPVNWTANSAINRGTGRNRLRLIVKGDTVVLMANDVVLQTVTAPSFGRGYIGLFVGTWDTPGLEVHFDNFKVYSVP